MEKSLCSPTQATPPQRIDTIFAGPAKFAPGYLLALSGKSSNSLAEDLGVVPQDSACRATGYPVWERAGAVGEALLSKYGLPLGDAQNITAMVYMQQQESRTRAVSTMLFYYT